MVRLIYCSDIMKLNFPSTNWLTTFPSQDIHPRGHPDRSRSHPGLLYPSRLPRNCHLPHTGRTRIRRLPPPLRQPVRKPRCQPLLSRRPIRPLRLEICPRRLFRLAMLDQRRCLLGLCLPPLRHRPLPTNDHQANGVQDHHGPTAYRPHLCDRERNHHCCCLCG